MSVAWEQFTRALVERRARAARNGSADDKDRTGDAPTPASTLLFESLEPRLLLAADPLGIAAGYAFNETGGTSTVDASGHGITGTLTNGPTFAAGKYGNAVALDGVNDFVNLGNPAALQLTGSMTVSAWIYSTSYPGDDASIVSKRTSGGVGFQLDTTVDTGRRTIGFKLTSSSGGLMARYATRRWRPTPGTMSPASTMPRPARWTCISMACSTTALCSARSPPRSRIRPPPTSTLAVAPAAGSASSAASTTCESPTTR
jgi:hypothetical protein